jgi:chemotaxis family two-component system response regulator Rcp1
METNGHSVIEILLVEDSPSDAFITQEALKEAKFSTRVHLVPDGVEAMAFLRRAAPYAKSPRPDIILLDLNTPRKDGREVLDEVKADGQLKLIPVVVLTSSSAESDIHKAYELHANCYITKPSTFDNFKNVVRALENFWFNCVTLPVSK